MAYNLAYVIFFRVCVLRWHRHGKPSHLESTVARSCSYARFHTKNLNKFNFFAQKLAYVKLL